MDAAAARLLSLARQLNLSRAKLAAELRISESSVSMMFAGYHKLRPVVALAAQAVYNVRAEWLLSGKKPVFLRPDKRAAITDEAQTIALQYDALPRSLKTSVRDVLAGFSKLKNGTAT
jgi:transcriptional regulator with XRE-family HTH domain